MSDARKVARKAQCMECMLCGADVTRKRYVEVVTQTLEVESWTEAASRHLSECSAARTVGDAK